MNISSSPLSDESHPTIVVKQENGILEPSAKQNTVLFVSGLKDTVTSSDIRQNFPGSIKVTMKHFRSDEKTKCVLGIFISC